MSKELTLEWSNYDHSKGYEKAMQDVRLTNGDEIYCCWPNAGVWNIMKKDINPKYFGTTPETTETSQVRLTHYNDWT